MRHPLARRISGWKIATRWVVAVAVTGLFAVGAPLAHSQSARDDERFAETTDVLLVQIPVYVTKDGVPVRGLTAKDFEVIEGKKKQPVVALDVYDLSQLDQAAEERGGRLSLPPSGRRNFVMLFDLSNSLPSGTVRATEAALELARDEFHPTDLVAAATYSRSKGIDLLMGFSTDRAQLEAAISDLGLVQPYERINDPLRLKIAEMNTSLQEGGGLSGGSAGLGMAGVQDILLQNLRDMSVLTSRASRDQVKQQITDLAVNLDSLARLLDSASGRKQILLFSEGFDSEVVFGTRNMARIGEMVESVQFGEYWRVDSEERFGASDAQGTLLQMLGQFNRSDCAVHTIDTGGLAAGGEAAVVRAAGQDFGGTGPLDRGHDGLALMAKETGGEFYRNYNDLSDAMTDLMERTSVTYVLSIEPRNLVLDGSYRPLKIRLKGAEKGVRLSHRPGYYARRPFSELDAAERQLMTAEQVIAGGAGGRIGTEVLAAAFPGAGPTAYVMTAIEVHGRSLTADMDDNMLPLEIYTYAFADDGQIRDFHSQAVMLDLYKVGYRLNTGFKLLSHLDLAPGDYEIRSLVRNARTGASGLAVNRISVPTFEPGTPALLPPFFIEPENHWLVGLEERDERTAPYPLMGGQTRLIPASRPQLATGETIPMLLVGHDLPRTLEAEGHLVGEDGKIHRGVEISVERRLADRGEGERLMTSIQAPPVGPGSYRLVVTVRGDGAEASSSLPVRLIDLR